MQPHLRRALPADLQAISDLAKAAFGPREGAEIAGLIAALLVDPSAQPVLSLVATVDNAIVGHILFSKVRLDSCVATVPAAILAPLSVHPRHQFRGIGGRLVTEGLSQLAEAGVELVFVLGHPGYYPRFGFSEAGVKGFEAHHPIPREHAGAWMVKELRPGACTGAGGRVTCADALADPKYWRE